MLAFNRDYKLVVTKGTREVTIIPPFRLQFSCDKSISSDGINKMQASVFGLKKDTRQIFHRDSDDDETLITVELSVGYQDRIKLLFSGEIHRGSSALTSNSYVTKFEAMDGGQDYLNSYTSATVTGKSNALNTIISDMPNTTLGKTTSFSDLTRPKVLMGASSKLIEDLTADDETFYINNGKVNILKDDEVVSKYIPVVSAETGLINTPEKENEKVTFQTMMSPFVVIGGLLELESFVESSLNGVYKVSNITYSGDTDGGDWKQTVTGTLTTNYTVL